MNSNHSLLDQNQHWRQIPSEKVGIFCGMIGKLPLPPKNSLCVNLHHAVSCYIQDYQSNQQLKSMFARVDELNRIEDIPKTKSRLCGGLLKKGEKAYRCYDCMTEDNSVLCEKCFQLQKHIGHDFQRFDVHGGCCDCGDVQKWKEQTFCCEHCKDEEIEVILDEKIVNLFLQEQLYGLQILLDMYSKYQYFKQTIEGENWNLPQMGDIQLKLKKNTIERAAKLIDLYGASYMSQLVQFNKAGKFANAMTDIFFKKQLTFQGIEHGNAQIITNTVFLHLFSMPNLKLVPEKMTDLCITMFPMVGFRETVTEIYINIYNSNPSFPPSAYSHLSSQLLTSYLAITKLIKSGRMNALKYQPECKSQREVANIAQGYIRYYYDITYLSKLYGDASIDYLRLTGHQKMFYALGYYRLLFDGFERAIDYYGLQQAFLEKMIPLINAIKMDKSNEICTMALKQLYKFITTVHTSSHNKYRPQERLFTLILFVRYDGDLSFLDDPTKIEELLNLLGVQNFQNEAYHIITNICSVLKTAAGILDGNQSIHHVYTFYSFYLKKQHLLFNLDAILLKIFLKLSHHYQKTNPFFNYSSFLLLGNTKDPYFVINEEFDETAGDAMPQLNNIRCLTNYVSLVTQAIFSDLPILSVSCAILPNNSQRISLRKVPKLMDTQLALHYYECLLRSQDVGRIAIKTFKKEAQLFFNEQQGFRLFVDKFRDPMDPLKLVKREEQGLSINYLYFRSICRIPAEKYKNGNYSPPYMKWKKDEAIDIFLGRIDSSIKFILNNMQKDGLIIPEIANCKLIPDLITQLWKVSIFSQSTQSASLLQKWLNTTEVQRQIQHLGKDILTAIHRKEYHKDNIEEKRKQDLRKKLQDKKALVFKKMNQNAQKILQSQSCKNSQVSEARSESQTVCCLCKEINNEHLYLLGFTTFTSGNGWLGTDKTKNLLPIFESCGHAVHRECYVKMMTQNNLNRLYLFCPLCKKPTNILLPVCEVLDKQAYSLFIGYLYQIYRTLEIPQAQNQIVEGLYKSLLFQLIFKGLALPQEFRKNVKVYRTIYQVYCSLNSISLEGMQILAQSVKQRELVFDINALQIFKDIVGFITAMVHHLPYNATVSQSCQERLQALLSMLQHKQPQIVNQTQQQPPQISIIRSSAAFPIVEDNLAELNSKYRGKCLQCGLVTNNQMICLNCPNFVTCSNCTKSKLMDHSQAYHGGMAIFMRTSTGETFYIMRNRYWRFQSLYEDYMGRAYEGSIKTREGYRLNLARLQDVKRDIMLMKIEQKVRFKENETKKVFNQEIV